MSLNEDLLQHLLYAVDPVVAAEYSFANFHTRGLTYINLLRTPALTAKLYIIEPGAVQHNAQGYLVNPHNHSYCFHTFVVQGWMRNISFVKSNNSHTGSDHRLDSTLNLQPSTQKEPWERFDYNSPLRGGNGFIHRGSVALQAIRNPVLYVGDSYYLRDDEVHTIVVPENERVVLFLLQYADIRLITNYYQKDKKPPSTEGLYTKMHVDDVRDCIDSVRQITRKQHEQV